MIADNLSTHKTQAVRTFLIEHPNVRLHFTPTYSSWLNQVELWFSKIERDLLARGIFTSVADLARKIRRYIRHYNKAPKPIRWAYRNPAHRISSTSASTGHWSGRLGRRAQAEKIGLSASVRSEVISSGAHLVPLVDRHASDATRARSANPFERCFIGLLRRMRARRSSS